jgi:2-dehydropantoate 2-reductase
MAPLHTASSGEALRELKSAGDERGPSRLDDPPLRICVAGAGAIGGTIAARCAAAGHHVSVLARGAHLRAIRESGLRFVDPGGSLQIKVAAAELPDFGPQDVIFVSVKAHCLADMLPNIAPLMHDDTVVVPTLNGIPWWYFQGEGGRFDGEVVRAVDPNGNLLRAVPWTRLIGCVVYIAAEVSEPGLVMAKSRSHRLVLGEPAHRSSARVTALAARLAEAGIAVETTERIRDAIWIKLLANLASNPLSVVAEATLEEQFNTPELLEIVKAIMSEAMQVGAAYGVRFSVDPEQIIEGGRHLGAFKTSMLQDFEKGQPLELAAIGDAVLELAARQKIAMPATRHVLALARFRSARHRPGNRTPENSQTHDAHRTQDSNRTEVIS